MIRPLINILERDNIRFPLYGLISLGIAWVGYHLAGAYQDWTWASFCWVLALLGLLNIIIGMRKYFEVDERYDDVPDDRLPPSRHSPMQGETKKGRAAHDLPYTLTSTIFYRFIVTLACFAIGYNAYILDNWFLSVLMWVLTAFSCMVLFAELMRQK